MWAARSPLEERVYSRCGAGRSRRRARGDGVLVCGAESPLPCLCGGLFSRERGRSPSFFLGQSLAPPLVCKKLRVCRRTHRHGGYYYYVIAPGSGRGRARPQLAPPSSQCESCAFPSCSRDLPLSRSARAPPRPSRSTSRTVVSLDRGSRVWDRKWPPEIRSCSGYSERSSSKLCYHVGACHPASPATETKQPWHHWVQLA